MTKTEALKLLAQIAPEMAAPKTRVTAFLEALLKKRGLEIGLDNVTGDWVILNAKGAVIARCA